jgi:hypothetical protein
MASVRGSYASWSGAARFVTTGLLWVLLAVPAAAAPRAPRDQNPATATPPPPVSDPDRQLNLAEPDFTLGALPTTLRMPAGTFAFRLTHRFARPIASGSAGDFFADFFGFDGAARIGLELRYGIRPGTQVTVHRTNNRAIQLLGQQQLMGQREGRPLSIDAVVAVEGSDNFSEDFGTTIAGVVSHRIKTRATLYVEPIMVFNANPAEALNAEPDYTVVLGVGGRLRLGESKVYIVAEVAPRLGGYQPGVDHASFGLERRAGGHLFQITVSNALGTTLRQVAQGGFDRRDWFIGFNLSRRFF